MIPSTPQTGAIQDKGKTVPESCQPGLFSHSGFTTEIRVPHGDALRPSGVGKGRRKQGQAPCTRSVSNGPLEAEPASGSQTGGWLVSAPGLSAEGVGEGQDGLDSFWQQCR